MYKKILWFLVFLLIVVIGAFVAIVYFDMNENLFKKEDNPISEVENESEDVNEDAKMVDGDLDEEAEEDKYVNPFHEEYTQADLTDDHYQDYIHKMSHQKVIADAKWGFYLITDERIDWLLESLEKTNDSLGEGNVYKEILTRWKDGDFSMVDQDHNVIWNLQGGSIGEATGILSEDEEKGYIENTQEEKGKTE